VEEETEGATAERRATPPAFTLTDGLEVEVVLPLTGSEDHLVLPGRVVRLTGSTVTVALHDGASALAIAMRPRCVLVWGEEGSERAALVRSGSRVDDVHSSTTIELVLEDVRDLATVVSGSADTGESST
jgi:hypothetical protein